MKKVFFSSVFTFFNENYIRLNSVSFFLQTGYLLTENIYHQMQDPSNRVDNLEHLFCTIGLIALEMGAEEVSS